MSVYEEQKRLKNEIKKSENEIDLHSRMIKKYEKELKSLDEDTKPPLDYFKDVIWILEDTLGGGRYLATWEGPSQDFIDAYGTEGTFKFPSTGLYMKWSYDFVNIIPDYKNLSTILQFALEENLQLSVERALIVIEDSQEELRRDFELLEKFKEINDR